MEKYFEINDNGLSIKCKLYYKDIRSIGSIIISCHGFCGNKENAFSKKLATKVLEKHDDCAVLTFDWPCHGKDVRQKLNLTDCNNYMTAVIKYIYSKFNIVNLYCNATSFGGYLTLKYIHENGNPFKRIILRCPAVNMGNVLYNIILTNEDREQLLKKKDVVAGFEKKVRISPQLMQELISKDITKWDYSEDATNILIMHGTKDELIPFDVVEQFAKINSIDFISVDGADHMFQKPALMNEAIEYSVEFIFDESLDQEIKK